MNDLTNAALALGNALEEWRDAGGPAEEVIHSLEDFVIAIMQPGAKRLVLPARRPPERSPTPPAGNTAPERARTLEGSEG
jgi:hypothetical protein